ncbi:MAG: SDR family oxidoreductase [Arthrobacter sp.]|jgi:NAD(P)-dependent dehydrogenase (short-subunit alcohol dehydrogenase family)|nr:SDR family oxidoreductase [Arthrobacter sp.]
MLPLQDKTILITGAGSGIGQAAAVLAASQGAAVAVVDRDAVAVEVTVSLVSEAGGTAWGLVVDVSDESSFDEGFERAVAHFGQIHGVVNNAGILSTGTVADTTVADWDRLMNVNAKGVFLGCRNAVRHFLAAGIKGAIVNTASISAQVGLPQQAAYCASKGAVLLLTKQIAADFSALGIRCNSVGPGSVMTPVLRDYLEGQGDGAAALSALQADHPIGRIAEPSEIAAAMCFLLSDAASFITGTNLQVDGGYTAV